MTTIAIIIIVVVIIFTLAYLYDRKHACNCGAAEWITFGIGLEHDNDCPARPMVEKYPYKPPRQK